MKALKSQQFTQTVSRSGKRKEEGTLACSNISDKEIDVKPQILFAVVLSHFDILV